MAREFERTLKDIDKRCQKSQTPYALIGGLAAIIYGSTRTTVDVDIVVLAELDALENVLKIFSTGYASLQPQPLSFFKRCFFVPLQNAKTKIRVDVVAALSGFERKVLARSQRHFFDKIEVSVCSIEDLLLMKLVAARAKDELDLDKLVQLHRKQLDLKHLRARAKEFVEVERSDVPERLEKLLRKYR